MSQIYYSQNSGPLAISPSARVLHPVPGNRQGKSLDPKLPFGSREESLTVPKRAFTIPQVDIALLWSSLKLIGKPLIGKGLYE
jgi:hypothetical protein